MRWNCSLGDALRSDFRVVYLLALFERAQCFPTARPSAETIHIKVDNGGGVEREHLAHHQTSDDGDTQRPAKFGAVPSTDGDGKAAKHRSHRGHHDGSEAQETRLINRFFGIIALVALGIDGEIDHQDRVFLHDTDQQDDADKGDNAEFGVEDQ